MATSSFYSSPSYIGKGGSVWTSPEGKDPDAAWYAQDLQKYAAQKGYEAQYDAVDKQYSGNTGNSSSSSGSGGSASSSGSSGSSSSSSGDWNSSNPNYSYSTGSSNFSPQDYYSLAKDLSQQQLDNSVKMMGESSKYRSIEADQNTNNNLREANQNAYNTDVLAQHQSIYGQQSYTAKTTDDMRKDTQQYGFQEALDNLKYGHESEMQSAGFQQDKDMLGLQDNYQSQQKQNNRQAASNLYNTSGKSPFWGGY